MQGIAPETQVPNRSEDDVTEQSAAGARFDRQSESLVPKRYERCEYLADDAVHVCVVVKPPEAS